MEFATEGEQAEGEDGKSARCWTHRQLEGRAPEWGLSGDRTEVSGTSCAAPSIDRASCEDVEAFRREMERNSIIWEIL